MRTLYFYSSLLLVKIYFFLHSVFLKVEHYSWKKCSGSKLWKLLETRRFFCVFLYFLILDFSYILKKFLMFKELLNNEWSSCLKRRYYTEKINNKTLAFCEEHLQKTSKLRPLKTENFAPFLLKEIVLEAISFHKPNANQLNISLFHWMSFNIVLWREKKMPFRWSIEKPVLIIFIFNNYKIMKAKYILFSQSN